ncbi:hypothetical protein PG989_001935, partial [Apiospora arundinis]
SNGLSLFGHDDTVTTATAATGTSDKSGYWRARLAAYNGSEFGSPRTRPAAAPGIYAYIKGYKPAIRADTETYARNTTPASWPAPRPFARAGIRRVQGRTED